MLHVIPFSGGFDSAAVLLDTLHCMKHAHGPSTVRCVSFDYGQRNRLEIRYAAMFIAWVNRVYRARVTHTVVNVADVFRMLIPCDMTRGTRKFNYKADTPTSYVPLRNGIFLTLAAAHGVAVRKKASDHVTVRMGTNATDNGMPDASIDFRRAADVMIRQGVPPTGGMVRCAFPFSHMTKREMYDHVIDLYRPKGVDADTVDEALRNSTLSCHYGEDELHAWGRGCGKCAPCKWRQTVYP